MKNYMQSWHNMGDKYSALHTNRPNICRKPSVDPDRTPSGKHGTIPDHVTAAAWSGRSHLCCFYLCDQKRHFLHHHTQKNYSQISTMCCYPKTSNTNHNNVCFWYCFAIKHIAINYTTHTHTQQTTQTKQT